MRIPILFGIFPTNVGGQKRINDNLLLLMLVDGKTDWFIAFVFK